MSMPPDLPPTRPEGLAPRLSARWGRYLRSMDLLRAQQLLVLCTASAILITMLLIISMMMVTDRYDIGVMTAVDAGTVLLLGLAILLALRGLRPQLQGLLLCMSIPLNLMGEMMFDAQGAWVALLLLSLSPIIWGLFAPMLTCILYSGVLIGFFNFYLGHGGEQTIMFRGEDQTVLTSIALSVIVVASAVSAIVPKRITTAAYSSMKSIARKQAAQRERFRHYANMSSDWHLEIDRDGIITDFFGVGNAVGEHWRDLLFDWEEEEHIFRTAIIARAPYHNIKATLRTGGVSRRVECSGQPIFDEAGEFMGYRAVAHDISERVEAEESLKRTATTDRLTGLRNRHAFNALIDALACLPGDKQTAVLYIDLDKFKDLNDRQGHACGDEVLAELGRRFRRVEAETPDLQVFRLGGDEFCALFNAPCTPARLKDLCEIMQGEISKPVALDGRLVDLTGSIGAARTDDFTSLEQAIERADAAVYEAKSSGGGKLVVPEGAALKRLERRIAVRRDLTGAIANGDIRLVYQPIYDVQTRQLCGVEALARWDHPDFGNIPPDQFIEIAEGSRDIIALGRHVLHQACTDMLARFGGTGDLVRLNVNVSPNEVVAFGFVDGLFKTLNETGFPPDMLELEITERGVLSNLEASIDILGEVRRRGVTIALDDFGTGHSSLSRLESLPVDRVKIDRSFFLRAHDNRRAQQILGLLSGMSRILNVDVVAEGIETEDQLRFVELAGFAKVQGYLLGRPASLDRLATGGMASVWPAGVKQSAV